MPNFPAPQYNPSSYFPGATSYDLTSQIGSYRLPYDPMDVSARVNQSMVAPDFGQNLRSFGNTGVATNSPARMYLASVAGAQGESGNAQNRAMMPLGFQSQNMQVLLNQQAARDAEAAAMAGLSQGQWQQRAMSARQATGAPLNDMLGPFLQMLMGAV